MTSSQPNESDWKRFSRITTELRDRYLVGVNRRIAALLVAPHKTGTDRFWDAHKIIEKEAEILRICLDDLRRSRMVERMLDMKRVGMLTDEDLEDFSPELRELLR